MKRRNTNSSQQLGLFDEMPAAHQEEATPPTVSPPVPDQSQAPRDLQPSEIDAMRAWLMDWGKRHDYPCFGFPFHYPPRNEDSDRRFGRTYFGEAGWKHDLQPPYNQRERYAGEWLVKAIEQVKRYDAGEQKIPEQISRMQHERGSSFSDEEN